MSMHSIFKYFDERYKDLLDPSRKPYIVGGNMKRQATEAVSSDQATMESSDNQKSEYVETVDEVHDETSSPQTAVNGENTEKFDSDEKPLVKAEL